VTQYRGRFRAPRQEPRLRIPLVQPSCTAPTVAQSRCDRIDSALARLDHARVAPLIGSMNLPDSETDLIRCLARVGAGDRAAFSRLYDQSASRLFALALGICRRRTLAEDVLQEAYVRIWRHAAQYDPSRGDPMAWLATIVRRLAIDALRRTGNESPLEPGFDSAIADPDPDPLVQTMRTQEAAVIRRCLDQLEPRQRSCILLA